MASSDDSVFSFYEVRPANDGRCLIIVSGPNKGQSKGPSPENSDIRIGQIILLLEVVRIYHFKKR